MLLWLRAINQLKKMDTNKLKSRKLWVTVLGAALVTLGTELGMKLETVQSVVAVLAAYLVGQGLADHGKSAGIWLAGMLGFLAVSASSPVAVAGDAAAVNLDDGKAINITLPEVPGQPDPDWMDKGSIWGFGWYDVSDDGYGTGVRLGYELTSTLRLRFDYLVEDFDYDTGTVTDASEATISMRVDLSQGNNLFPYLIAGGGSASLSSFSWEYLIGAGVDYEFANGLTVFAEILHIRTEDSQFADRNEVRVGAGVTFAALGKLLQLPGAK